MSYFIEIKANKVDSLKNILKYFLTFLYSSKSYEQKLRFVCLSV